MSQRRTKKNTIKNNTKNRKSFTLRLDNGVEIPAKTIHIRDTKYFKIDDIDINKIRISDGKIFSKEHNSYKYYIFYEDDNRYFPLKIIFKDVVGYYNVLKIMMLKTTLKKMNFNLDDVSQDKMYDIFEHIEEKLGIGLSDFIYESKGEEYLKTNVSNDICFKDNAIPNENTKYNCRVLLRTQSVFYSMKDKDNVKYYPQIYLEQCVYRIFSNNALIYSDLEFTDTEPDSESEEEINENTVF